MKIPNILMNLIRKIKNIAIKAISETLNNNVENLGC